jgi:hypothetical protein
MKSRNKVKKMRRTRKIKETIIKKMKEMIGKSKAN